MNLAISNRRAELAAPIGRHVNVASERNALSEGSRKAVLKVAKLNRPNFLVRLD